MTTPSPLGGNPDPEGAAAGHGDGGGRQVDPVLSPRKPNWLNGIQLRMLVIALVALLWLVAQCAHSSQRDKNAAAESQTQPSISVLNPVPAVLQGP